MRQNINGTPVNNTSTQVLSLNNGEIINLPAGSKNPIQNPIQNPYNLKTLIPNLSKSLTNYGIGHNIGIEKGKNYTSSTSIPEESDGAVYIFYNSKNPHRTPIATTIAATTVPPPPPPKLNSVEYKFNNTVTSNNRSVTINWTPPTPISSNYTYKFVYSTSAKIYDETITTTSTSININSAAVVGIYECYILVTDTTTNKYTQSNKINFTINADVTYASAPTINTALTSSTVNSITYTFSSNSAYTLYYKINGVETSTGSSSSSWTYYGSGSSSTNSSLLANTKYTLQFCYGYESYRSPYSANYEYYTLPITPTSSSGVNVSGNIVTLILNNYSTDLEVISSNGAFTPIYSGSGTNYTLKWTLPWNGSINTDISYKSKSGSFFSSSGKINVNKSISDNPVKDTVPALSTTTSTATTITYKFSSIESNYTLWYTVTTPTISESSKIKINSSQINSNSWIYSGNSSLIPNTKYTLKFYYYDETTTTYTTNPKTNEYYTRPVAPTFGTPSYSGLGNTAKGLIASIPVTNYTGYAVNTNLGSFNTGTGNINYTCSAWNTNYTITVTYTSSTSGFTSSVDTTINAGVSPIIELAAPTVSVAATDTTLTYTVTNNPNNYQISNTIGSKTSNTNINYTGLTANTGYPNSICFTDGINSSACWSQTNYTRPPKPISSSGVDLTRNIVTLTLNNYSTNLEVISSNNIVTPTYSGSGTNYTLQWTLPWNTTLNTDISYKSKSGTFLTSSDNDKINVNKTTKVNAVKDIVPALSTTTSTPTTITYNFSSIESNYTLWYTETTLTTSETTKTKINSSQISSNSWIYSGKGSLIPNTKYILKFYYYDETTTTYTTNPKTNEYYTRPVAPTFGTPSYSGLGNTAKGLIASIPVTNYTGYAVNTNLGSFNTGTGNINYTCSAWNTNYTITVTYTSSTSGFTSSVDTTINAGVSPIIELAAPTVSVAATDTTLTYTVTNNPNNYQISNTIGSKTSNTNINYTGLTANTGYPNSICFTDGINSSACWSQTNYTLPPIPTSSSGVVFIRNIVTLILNNYSTNLEVISSNDKVAPTFTVNNNFYTLEWTLPWNTTIDTNISYKSKLGTFLTSSGKFNVNKTTKVNAVKDIVPALSTTTSTPTTITYNFSSIESNYTLWYTVTTTSESTKIKINSSQITSNSWIYSGNSSLIPNTKYTLKFYYYDETTTTYTTNPKTNEYYTRPVAPTFGTPSYSGLGNTAKGLIASIPVTNHSGYAVTTNVGSFNTGTGNINYTCFAWNTNYTITVTYTNSTSGLTNSANTPPINAGVSPIIGLAAPTVSVAATETTLTYTVTNPNNYPITNLIGNKTSNTIIHNGSANTGYPNSICFTDGINSSTCWSQTNYTLPITPTSSSGVNVSGNIVTLILNNYSTDLEVISSNGAFTPIYSGSGTNYTLKWTLPWNGSINTDISYKSKSGSFFSSSGKINVNKSISDNPVKDTVPALSTTTSTPTTITYNFSSIESNYTLWYTETTLTTSETTKTKINSSQISSNSWIYSGKGSLIPNTKYILKFYYYDETTTTYTTNPKTNEYYTRPVAPTFGTPSYSGLGNTAKGLIASIPVTNHSGYAVTTNVGSFNTGTGNINYTCFAWNTNYTITVTYTSTSTTSTGEKLTNSANTTINAGVNPIIGLAAPTVSVTVTENSITYTVDNPNNYPISSDNGSKNGNTITYSSLSPNSQNSNRICFTDGNGIYSSSCWNSNIYTKPLVGSYNGTLYIQSGCKYKLAGFSNGVWYDTGLISSKGDYNGTVKTRYKGSTATHDYYKIYQPPTSTRCISNKNCQLVTYIYDYDCGLNHIYSYSGDNTTYSFADPGGVGITRLADSRTPY